MKKILIFTALLLIAAGCNENTKESSTASLTNQQNCAQSASAYFKNNNVVNTNVVAGATEYFSFTNHYDTQLNKCFILIHDSDPTAPLFRDSYYLIDVFENKEIANTSSPQPSYSQPQAGCNPDFIKEIGYSYTACSDLSSFNDFIKPYMNN